MATSLVIRQSTHTFTAAQEGEVLNYLRRIDRLTIKQNIVSPRDIELNSRGRLVSNGYLLTPLAFKQLCTFVAKGLYGLVADIGAVIGNARSCDAYSSTALAAEIINKVVSLRFSVPDGISGKAMILNTESKTVDGIVGARYRYLPHYQLYDAVKETLTAKMNVQHYQTIVTGRRCAFILLDFDNAYVNVDMQVGAQPLIYFTNSEAGEAGIHACAGLLIDERCLLYNLNHVPHTNQAFEARLGVLIERTLEQHAHLVPRMGDTMRAYGTPLNIVKENKIWEERRQNLIKIIVAHGVDRLLAKELVRKAIFQGADGTVVPDKISIEEIKYRTYRDLVVTMCRESTEQYHNIREAISRAAFSFIS